MKRLLFTIMLVVLAVLAVQPAAATNHNTATMFNAVSTTTNAQMIATTVAGATVDTGQYTMTADNTKAVLGRTGYRDARVIHVVKTISTGATAG